MITAFRDGFQSVYGARVLTQDFLPAVTAAVHAGLSHFEAGGGARFQSLYFYCNEDAFSMMDQFRQAAGPDANLQTLSRGINVVGLDSQPKDMIKLHAQLFAKHGMTTIRNFDALNDVNNLIYSGQCIVEAGLQHEVCVTMMELPPGFTGAHDAPFYLKVLRQILDQGIPYHSVCFKDASGTSTPSKVYETIKGARALLPKDMKLVFHTHETAGTGVYSYISALEAGADQIDLSLAPVSGGTAQPDLITMWHALRGSQYDLGIDIAKVMKAEEVFKESMKDYFTPPEATMVEPLIPFFPMPGGALTANTQMLRDNNLMNRYDEIIQSMGEAVAKGGFGTSVTPVSQFYFQQAFNNVIFGPWKKIAEGYGKMVLGYFGKTPAEPDAEVVRLAAEQLGLPPTTESPLIMNDKDPKKGRDAAEAMLNEASLPLTDENVFIAAACREKGILFLQGKATVNVRKKAPEGNQDGKYTVKVDGKAYHVTLEGEKAIVNGKPYPLNIAAGHDESLLTTSAPVPTAGVSLDATEILAPLPGLILRFVKNPGDSVEAGEAILIMESMKMEAPITVESAGVIQTFAVKQGDQINAGQVLAILEAN